MIAESQPAGLNIGGWIVMVTCIGFVCTLGAICFWRILMPASGGGGSSAESDAWDRE